MEIKLKNYNHKFEPKVTKMVCIPMPKTSDVHLAFAFDNVKISKNFSFALINMHNGEAADKKSQFEALCKLGQEIADAWNEKHKIK